MTIMAIRQFGDNVLKQKSMDVGQIDKETRMLAKIMADTMYHAQGLGLAAVQVGILQKVIVTDISGDGKELKALINPRIIEKSGEEVDEEGCLSLQEIKIPIKRAVEVKVKGIDLQTGEEVEIEAKGLYARALQHEIDHIEGRLILDIASKEDKYRAIKQLALGISE